MSANLLTVNSSKTEFLIIGLKRQLSKIDNSLNITNHSARSLDYISDEHFTYSDQISSLSMQVLHVLWLKLLNFLMSHPSSDLCTGSRLTNALNINFSCSPIKFSQPANLTTYTT